MFKAYDYYEGRLFVGAASTYAEAKKIAKQFEKDTDGECDIEIIKIK